MRSIKKFTVRDLNIIQQEFYKSYDLEYWFNKIELLFNVHENFNKIEKNINLFYENKNVENLKRMLRTEIHFTYFQMIETLFEIIFAISEHNNKYLWLALTFSNDRKTDFYSNAYTKINKFSKGTLHKPDFGKLVKVELANKEIMEIPLLRWIYYFIFPTDMTPRQWVDNLERIEQLLRVFAKDFSDRGEYNAYKHSGRYYSSKFSLNIGLKGKKKNYNLGHSEDAVVYIDEEIKKDENGKFKKTGRLWKVVKPFDYLRDYKCCEIINYMIKTIISTRKYTILPELHGKDFNMYKFYQCEFPKVILPRTGVSRWKEII